jgi:DNA gyrase/topoisomerase IV subunit B
MSGVVSGLSAADRNLIGIYALKGKIMNVRCENIKKIYDNKEISELKRFSVWRTDEITRR